MPVHFKVSYFSFFPEAFQEYKNTTAHPNHESSINNIYNQQNELIN
jgi:hypothetical protein